MTCFVMSLQIFSRAYILFLGVLRVRIRFFFFSSSSCYFKVATIIYLLLTCGLKLMAITALSARFSVWAITSLPGDSEWNSLHATYQLESVCRLLFTKTAVSSCSYMFLAKLTVSTVVPCWVKHLCEITKAIIFFFCFLSLACGLP